MKWSFDSDAPIYAQLIEQIKIAIVTRVFAPGDRLPSVRDLATEAGVNPNTMQRALTQLEAEGLVRSQRTAGRYVTDDEDIIAQTKNELARKHVAAFLAAMERLGIHEEEALALVMQAQGKENPSDANPEL